jgi:hypothetical protein
VNAADEADAGSAGGHESNLDMCAPRTRRSRAAAEARSHLEDERLRALSSGLSSRLKPRAWKTEDLLRNSRAAHAHARHTHEA